MTVKNFDVLKEVEEQYEKNLSRTNKHDDRVYYDGFIEDYSSDPIITFIYCGGCEWIDVIFEDSTDDPADLATEMEQCEEYLYHLHFAYDWYWGQLTESDDEQDDDYFYYQMLQTIGKQIDYIS